MKTLTLRCPDDFHVHLRDGDVLSRTVPDTSAQFARALVMPNLVPAIAEVDAAMAYRDRILTARAAGNTFEPLMTLYLTDQTSPETIKTAAENPCIKAFKLYPQGATTNASQGIANLTSIYPLLEQLEKYNIVLAIHGESIDPHIDVFDREAIFIDRELIPLRKTFPALKIVLEHISTEIATNYVREAQNMAATITAHHLLYHRNRLFQGGINPHFYCLPLLKKSSDREALIGAATSGDPHFFLGTDSAPHALHQKEKCCGCAGIYTAYSALELYATVFEQAGALAKFEDFASRFGATFYGLPLNTGTITLTKSEWAMPENLSFGRDVVKPLCAGEKLTWHLSPPP